MKKFYTCASVLSADMRNLEKVSEELEKSGIEVLHFDVMDGVFVPNISFGFPILEAVDKCTDMFLDVHLMISDPYKYIPDFVNAGSDIITFHAEADSDIEKTIDLILASGKKAGLSVKPKTPVEAVYPYLDKLSMVLVMTVEPGFGGQSFMEDMMPKVSAVRSEIDRRGLDVDIQVDGGINKDTISIAAKAGANVFVSGNAIFSSDDAEKTIADFKARASV